MSYEFKPEDYEVKRDANGMIDLEYYYIKANEMHARHLMKMYTDAKKGIKGSIKAIYERFFCINCQPSH